MVRELIQFISERKKAVARVATARERKLARGKNRVKAGILRERFEDLLDGMKVWLAHGDCVKWLASIEPHTLGLVKKGIPLFRALRRMRVLETAFLEDLGKWRGSSSPFYSRHVALTNQFFNMLALSFAESYVKHANWLLRDAQVRHDSFLHNMIIPAFLADAEGRFEEINPAMCRFLRMRPEQIAGRSFQEFFSRACCGESSAKDVEKLWRTLQKEKQVDRFPLTLACSERGSLFVKISSTFRKNVDGKTIGIQGFIQDVTQQVESEKIAEEKHLALEAVFENAPVGLHYVDSSHVVQMINSTFMKNMGYKEDRYEEIIGATIEDRIPSIQEAQRDPAKIVAFIKKLVEDIDISLEEEFILNDNRTISMLSAPVHSKEKEFLGRITMNRDLTRERELERLRESLTQMIVHDLKNPLSAITFSMALLKQQADKHPDSPINEPLRVIAKSADAMMRMIMNLLDISRMEENKLDLTYEPLDILDFLRRLRPTLETMTGSRKLVYPRRRKMPVVEADRGILQRIIENIVGNASKHTRPDGRITIGVSRAAIDWLKVAISDNGEGIAKEDLTGIFEKFGQAAGRERGLQTDTGLGLTFCKMAVEVHGGSIHVDSEKGKGSTFTFLLPFKQPVPSRNLAATAM